MVKRGDVAHLTSHAGQCPINLKIVLGDACNREALIEARADFGAIEVWQSRYCRRGRPDTIDKISRHAVVDDFRRRAGAGKAMTGVPQAIASIMTRPKGSGHSIGKISAEASPINLAFSLSLISPMNSTLG